MTVFTFQKATKAQARARVAFAGPSGSGKTYTSLRTARALGQRIAVIDTERGSASKYADEFDFDTLAMNTFDPRDLVKALAAAGAAGYDVAVVDSLSHFWSGTGGMLEQVDHAARRSGGGNSFAGWKEARPMERAMVDALLAYPGHVIVTMRTKTEYVVEEDSRGRKVPRKVGLKPEQRDGIEYEFDIVGDLDLENTLVVAKSRCKVLAKAVIQLPDEESFGGVVRAWLEDGAAPAFDALAVREEVLAPGLSRDELYSVYQRVEAAGQLGAPVVDDNGDPTTLGELIKAKGNAAKLAAVSSGGEAA
ncbi:ATP-binding protein [Dactylosporangium roseum]|uniref:ATP-binding protein n=1 Tax=Dactylosporangium roseum TaxID=47989 RepID=A0ABY5Z790_9ACTN|nr:ATP-binding protein [Dactylosporangium roseum]UWZ37926.1 ATP-binding protein [Dactylosporangium roseum]